MKTKIKAKTKTKMKIKMIPYFVYVLIIGGIGGILAGQFLMPYLANSAPFNKVSWIKRAQNSTTIINRTEQMVIEESAALEKAIDKNIPSVVGVVTRKKLASAKKNVTPAFYGSGLFATGDGLVLTVDTSAPEGNFDYFISRDNQTQPAEIIKRDEETGLVLLKIKETNLPVVSLGETNSLRLGQKLALLGADASGDSLIKTANFCVVRNLASNGFAINLSKEDPALTGAAIIDINGEVVGMAEIANSGSVRIISAEEISRFLK